MLAVSFDVGDVVDDVDNAGDQAEQGKPAQSSQERGPLEKLFVEDKRKKDEGVLRPLARTHGFEQGAKHGLILHGLRNTQHTIP